MALYKSISATTQIKVGATKLLGIFITSGTSPTVAVYDSATASNSDPTVLATLTAIAPVHYNLTGDANGLFLSKGCYVVLGGTNPVATIVYE